ncbi:MAG: hypothetical protein ACKO3K_18270 [Cuspidothrix sp.]
MKSVTILLFYVTRSPELTIHRNSDRKVKNLISDRLKITTHRNCDRIPQTFRRLLVRSRLTLR